MANMNKNIGEKQYLENIFSCQKLKRKKRSRQWSIQVNLAILVQKTFSAILVERTFSAILVESSKKIRLIRNIRFIKIIIRQNLEAKM